MRALRHLVLVLGDQLDDASAAFAGFDPARDAIWMCEAPQEAQQVWSHKARLVLFLSAMRHFAERLRARGWTVHYRATGTHPHATLAAALAADLAELRPQAVRAVEAGEWRVQAALSEAVAAAGLPMRWLDDQHFLCSRADFESWMQGRRQPRLEHFYRWMRQRTGLLMVDGKPAGGDWNYDADNRESFGPDGPPPRPARMAFAPDAITQAVIALVEQTYPDHPGSLQDFRWPLTREEALEALDAFIVDRLPQFGPYQDAMWVGEAWLWHSHLAPALNLKLLHPQEVCAAAEAAWQRGEAPLASVEGFIRQILGWREYVRGLYWHRMPGYVDENALGATAPLPAFYWTGETDMACLADALGQTLRTGYAHHIQRLMVTGLFALLLGVEPRQVHAWYLAIYVDAVEWVELPNVLGMSQFADGGWMASKPYVASGQYLSRMSNACAGCRYDPKQATGPRACPFTTLYWDFLDRHAARFESHPRLRPQILNVQRKPPAQREAIRREAALLRIRLGVPSPSRG